MIKIRRDTEDLQVFKGGQIEIWVKGKEQVFRTGIKEIRFGGFLGAPNFSVEFASWFAESKHYPPKGEWVKTLSSEFDRRNQFVRNLNGGEDNETEAERMSLTFPTNETIILFPPGDRDLLDPKTLKFETKRKPKKDKP